MPTPFTHQGGNLVAGLLPPPVGISTSVWFPCGVENDRLLVAAKAVATRCAKVWKRLAQIRAWIASDVFSRSRTHRSGGHQFWGWGVSLRRLSNAPPVRTDANRKIIFPALPARIRPSCAVLATNTPSCRRNRCASSDRDRRWRSDRSFRRAHRPCGTARWNQIEWLNWPPAGWTT